LLRCYGGDSKQTQDGEKRYIYIFHG